MNTATRAILRSSRLLGTLRGSPSRVAQPLRVNHIAPAAISVQKIYGVQARTFSDDGHPDFNPVRKATASTDTNTVLEKIAADVKAHHVVLYMKGTPEQPMCGFSRAVVQILNASGVPYVTRDVLSEPGVREGIKQFTNWATIPQVFIKGEFIGGCDIVLGMFKSGELDDVLVKAGLLTK